MSSNSIPYSTQSIADDDIDAVVAALRSGWLTTGPAIDAFETSLGRYVGGQAVVLSSGTAALHAAYEACGLINGTELITTPMTFVSTASMAVQLGAQVLFADVDPLTLNLDPGSASELVTSRTQAVCAVDFGGHPARLNEIRDLAKANGATFIEDASHSLGARYNDQPVGCIADLTTFSFHPVKAITTGEGGAVASRNMDLLQRIRQFRSHGMIKDSREHHLVGHGDWHQEVHAFGYNYRMPDPLAALGLSQLRRLDQLIHKRTVIAERYRRLLSGFKGIILPVSKPEVQHAWHLYTIRVLGGRRREVFDFLRSKGIGVQVHYLPVYMHPAFQELGYKAGMCPNAEEAYEQLISLPLFPELAESAQLRVVEALQAVLNE